MLEMLPPVFLLTLVSMCYGCQVGHSTECEGIPFVPGHNLVGEGFDIVHMKTTGAFVVDVQTYMNGGPTGNCTVCRNSLLESKIQKIPLAVTDWRVKVNCKQSISARVFESSSSVIKQSTHSTSIGWKVGIGLPMVAGVMVGGTLSKSSTFASSRSSSDKYSFTSHEYSCSYYSLRVRSPPPVSKEFITSVQGLPISYTSQTKSKFEHFISIYGTHYLRHVNLGGRVHSTTAIRTCQISMKGLTAHDIGICLSTEASAVIEGIQVKDQKSFCHKMGKKLEHSSSFSHSFSDRVTNVLGGDGQHSDILFNPNKQNGYTAWTKTLKTHPGVVSYRLTSLHMLVRHDATRREALRQAIHNYIMANAKTSSCSSKCKVGHRGPDCGCKCTQQYGIDANCCPSEPGMAKMNVTVERGAALWGDWLSKTDAYVKVIYEKNKEVTPVIWNNNFPVWNFLVQFGVVNLSKKTEITLEVWDRNNRWDDLRLGRHKLIPTQGINVKKKFGLKHGAIFVSFSATCEPSLQGTYCEKYAPSPDVEQPFTYPKLLQETMWNATIL